MDFNTFQKEARKSAIYPNLGSNLSYPTLGLCGEAGEVAEKVKKLFRDKKGKADIQFKTELLKELGDVLWYLSSLTSELGFELDDVARINVEKLNSRMKNNKIHGDGDNR